MADSQEKELLDRFNSLTEQVRALKRGDPRHIDVMARLVIARRELDAYRKKKKN